MTKNKKSLFNFEENEAKMKESDLRIARIVWFAFGFILALIVMFIALFPDAR